MHPFVQFKFSVYGHKQASKQASRHTHAHAQYSHASMGLAQARPNKYSRPIKYPVTGALVVPFPAPFIGVTRNMYITLVLVPW